MLWVAKYGPKSLRKPEELFKLPARTQDVHTLDLVKPYQFKTKNGTVPFEVFYGKSNGKTCGKGSGKSFSNSPELGFLPEVVNNKHHYVSSIPSLKGQKPFDIEASFVKLYNLPELTPNVQKVWYKLKYAIDNIQFPDVNDIIKGTKAATNLAGAKEQVAKTMFSLLQKFAPILENDLFTDVVAVPFSDDDSALFTKGRHLTFIGESNATHPTIRFPFIIALIRKIGPNPVPLNRSNLEDSMYSPTSLLAISGYIQANNKKQVYAQYAFGSLKDHQGLSHVFNNYEIIENSYRTSYVTKTEKISVETEGGREIDNVDTSSLLSRDTVRQSLPLNGTAKFSSVDTENLTIPKFFLDVDIQESLADFMSATDATGQSVEHTFEQWPEKYVVAFTKLRHMILNSEEIKRDFLAIGTATKEFYNAVGNAIMVSNITEVTLPTINLTQSEMFEDNHYGTFKSTFVEKFEIDSAVTIPVSFTVEVRF
jgi:hypothetical protein